MKAKKRMSKAKRKDAAKKRAGSMKKVMLKVVIRDEFQWRHLCRVHQDVFYKFFATVGCERSELADFIEKWALLDFNVHLKMTQQKDISILKKLVLDRSKKQYPHIYLEASNPNIDHQGWVRMWVTRHMKE